MRVHHILWAHRIESVGLGSGFSAIVFLIVPKFVLLSKISAILVLVSPPAFLFISLVWLEYALSLLNLLLLLSLFWVWFKYGWLANFLLELSFPWVSLWVFIEFAVIFSLKVESFAELVVLNELRWVDSFKELLNDLQESTRFELVLYPSFVSVPVCFPCFHLTCFISSPLLQSLDHPKTLFTVLEVVLSPIVIAVFFDGEVSGLMLAHGLTVVKQPHSAGNGNFPVSISDGNFVKELKDNFFVIHWGRIAIEDLAGFVEGGEHI